MKSRLQRESSVMEFTSGTGWFLFPLFAQLRLLQQEITLDRFGHCLAPFFFCPAASSDLRTSLKSRKRCRGFVGEVPCQHSYKMREPLHLSHEQGRHDHRSLQPGQGAEEGVAKQVFTRNLCLVLSGRVQSAHSLEPDQGRKPYPGTKRTSALEIVRAY